MLQPFRQLSDADGPIAIKRKALAILSVLAEADGALVTKDDLMSAVWPNVTVEENAIQAHVAYLRKILGGDAELLCTVHGHGYRLVQTPDASAARPEPIIATRPARPRHALWTALGLIAAIAGVSAWLWRERPPAMPVTKPAQIAILPFDALGPGPGMGSFARDLREKISDGLSNASLLVADDGKALTASEPGQSPAAEFLLSGRIISDAKAIDIHIQLSDAEEHVAIWSGTFHDGIGSQPALLTKVSAAVADAAHWAVIGRTGKVRLSAAGVAALVEARQSIAGTSRAASALEMANYKKIIALTPQFTWAHSGLAVADAFQLRFEPDNQALRDELRREANRALALEPHNGEAYVALEMALPRFQWKDREALLLKGIAVDPDFEPAAGMEGRLLWSVGRSKAALRWFKQAHNADPLHIGNNFYYATSLASEGYTADSRKLLESMNAQWPDNIKDARFWASVLSGATDDTEALLADATKWPVGMNEKSAEAWRSALAARGAKDNSMRREAIKAIKDTAAGGSLDHGEALLLLSMLNDVDDAFAQAQTYEPTDPRWAPYLFLGPTQAMRFDSRFMPLAVKYGFAAYWRSTNKWPDFCSAPGLRYDCKAVVDKLAAANSGLKPIAALRPLAVTN
jgi:DNA-binding winged helix-turn-helix (wHTH) protein/TolB-like protein